MTKNIFNYLLIGLFLVGFSACTKDETTRSVITNVPITIASVDADVTIEEQETVITVNFTMGDDQIVDTKVKIAVDPLTTTATEGVDFDLLTSEVSIDAYGRTGSFDVQIHGDYLPEGTEIASFIVSGINDPFGANNTKEFKITITDFVDPDKLILTFDWEGLGFYQEVGYSLCENVDLDILVLDTDGNDLGIYDGATAACPEVIIIDQTWPDGTYAFASNMWENGFAGLMSNNDFPIRVAIDKAGIYNAAFKPTDIWTSEDLDGANDGNNELKPAITVIKEGTNFKVYQPDGTLIIQG
jgi:hypothetical protein